MIDRQPPEEPGVDVDVAPSLSTHSASRKRNTVQPHGIGFGVDSVTQYRDISFVERTQLPSR